MSHHRWIRSKRSLIALTLGVVLFDSAFAETAKDGPLSSRTIRIVTTFLPVHILTLGVTNGIPGVEVSMLLPGDAGCAHHHSVRPSDMKLVAEADVVVANGLNMEPFLDALLRSAPEAAKITLADECNVIRSCSGRNHHHEKPHSDDDPSHGEANGHVWTSPLEAAKVVRLLGRRLGEIDGARSAAYSANASMFAAKLESLAKELEVDARSFTKRKVIASHDVFAYLARDLGLEVVAHVETEPGHTVSMRELRLLVDRIRESHAAAVLIDPNGARDIVETAAKETGVLIVVLNPITAIDGPVDSAMYERIMRKNMLILKKALGSS